MSPSRRTTALALALALASVSVACAQEALPHIGYASPAGGRRGTTFNVTLGGQRLGDLGRVAFSGGGIEARVVPTKPMTEDDVRALREKATQLTKDKKNVAALEEAARIQRRLVRYNAAQMRRQTQPSIGETVTLELTIRPDAAPGMREMRVETSRGVSNPLRFFVGTLREYGEREPELVLDQTEWGAPIRYPPLVTTDIELPAVANGQIIPRETDLVRYGPDQFTPGDADRYRFHARKGQKLVVAAAARELIPYLADAVPGWFQATLTVYDARGKELAFADDYRFHPDPVLLFDVPEDGQYVIEIKDAIHRGRPDFVYRITIGELPFVTSAFPLGGRTGTQTVVELKGWNLPADKLTVDARDKPPGVAPLAVRKGDAASNVVPFALDDLPERFEKEPNDALSAAQPAAAPAIVNGRIDRPGDWDVFRVEGRAGEEIVAEATARRLDSPLDSVLEVTDAAGKRLAFNDDHADKFDALRTHAADSFVRCALPADGTCFVRIGDAQKQGGPEHAYRLRIGPPRPDFALRVVPSCVHALSWRMTPLAVVAVRKDGFAGEIALRVAEPKEGILLDGGTLPAGQDAVRVTLAIAPWLPDPQPFRLEGRATIDGRDVVRAACGAEDAMQAFFYRHLVPAEDLRLVRVDRPRFPKPGERGPEPAKVPPPGRREFQSPIGILGDLPVRIPAGATVDVQVRTWMDPKTQIEIELSDPPEGVAVERVARTDKGIAVTLRGDAKAKPGLRGNLIANAFRKGTETTKDGKTRDFRYLQGPLPAIPFEIVPP